MKIAIAILTLIMFGAGPVFAQSAAGSDITKRIVLLIEKVDQLEKNQQQILATENEIMSQLQNLKIQARR